jgi:1,4-alpha-glucan branching enzyme
MSQGCVVLVLHAHLPYVLSHGKWPHGSDWLCEAVCETYIPLLNLLGTLSGEGRRANLTIGITPVLCEMLASRAFKTVLKAYIAEKMRAAAHDRRAFISWGQDDLARLAGEWAGFYSRTLNDFVQRYNEDLLGAFRGFQDEGQIEIIVSAATHAYLPLLGLDASINAQVKQGVETYRKYFGREPEGMWLPECAYRPPVDDNGGAHLSPRPGLESFLAAHNLKYFFLDGYHVLQKEPPDGYAAQIDRELSLEGHRAGQGRMGYPDGFADAAHMEPEASWTEEGQMALYGIHTTGRLPSGECAFFARDTASSLQVWSARYGYPGDPYYLEFHKKHDPGGMRYWRVTDHNGDLGSKALYEPGKAKERVAEHARHFSGMLTQKLDRYRRETGRTGVLTIPFDAELFGHWWFEGIDWLHALISAFDPNYVTIEQASTALKSITPLGTVSLPEGSWGAGGRHLIWYNKETAWTWGYIYEAERDMADAVKNPYDDTVLARILKQMARELFLLQSSDWQFLITTRSAGEYGSSRFLGHYHAFKDLKQMSEDYRRRRELDAGDEQMLRDLEARDAVFDNVKLEWFSERI